MHLGLKRNFQVMPGAQWLELLCRHSPDRYEHLVRFRRRVLEPGARVERAKALKGRDTLAMPAAPRAPLSAFAASAKAAWARLTRKVYDADPLECPQCKGPKRVIALIDDPARVRRILEDWGRWAPDPGARAPPAPVPEGPANAVTPLTYHPIWTPPA